MNLYFNGKTVVVTRTEHNDGYVDIIEAYDVDSGDDLTQFEKNRVSKHYQDVLYQDWCGVLLDRASDLELEAYNE